MARAAEKNKDVRYDPQLIDATYALLLSTYGEPMVIPTLNRDGDCMPDMGLQMFGPIAGAGWRPPRVAGAAAAAAGASRGSSRWAKARAPGSGWPRRRTARRRPWRARTWRTRWP